MNFMPDPICVVINKQDAVLLWNEVGDILRKDMSDLELMNADERIREYIPGEFKDTPIENQTFEYILVSMLLDPFIVRYPLTQEQVDNYIDAVKDQATITYASPLYPGETHD